jgi:hypothetical protein
VTNRHRTHPFRRIIQATIGEIGQDCPVNVNQAFLDGKTNGGRREALAQGKHLVRIVAAKRTPIALVNQLSVANNQKTMQLIVTFQSVKAGQATEQPRTMYTLQLRDATLKTTKHQTSPESNFLSLPKRHKKQTLASAGLVFCASVFY